jgi:hypothetical protein
MSTITCKIKWKLNLFGEIKEQILLWVGSTKKHNLGGKLNQNVLEVILTFARLYYQSNLNFLIFLIKLIRWQRRKKEGFVSCAGQQCRPTLSKQEKTTDRHLTTDQHEHISIRKAWQERETRRPTMSRGKPVHKTHTAENEQRKPQS